MMHRASADCSKRTRPAFGKRPGAMVVVLIFGLVVLLGISSLALNLTWLTGHRVQLKRACQAAALAGAAQLLDPTAGTISPAADAAASVRTTAAIQQAQLFFTKNIAVTLDPSDFVLGWCETPTEPHTAITPWSGAGPVNSISIRGMRRRSNGQAVIMWFGGFFGIPYAEPADAATASMDQRVCGFRPLEYVAVPIVPLLVPSTMQWPYGAVGASTGFSDSYTVDPRTGAVTAGPDGIGEVTLLAPVAGGSIPSGQAATWLCFPNTATHYETLMAQVRYGIEPVDLVGMGGELVLGVNGTMSMPAALLPDATQASQLLSAMLAIRGQRRIWPIGSLIGAGSQSTCQITGFVAGNVVDCTSSENALTIVVQACTVQTNTALLRDGIARNPWIGKIILNE